MLSVIYADFAKDKVRNYKMRVPNIIIMINGLDKY